MKKVAFIVLLMAVACASAQAKIFAFGVKAGLEMPSLKTENLSGSAKASTGFHAGILAQFNIPIVGIGVQPEVLYAYRGEKVFDGQSEKNKGVSFIDIPLNVTWGIDLKVIRPFVAVTPYISYAFSDVKTWVANNDPSAFQKVDNLNYGIGVGAGIELFQKLQVMGRYSWGLKNLVSDGSYKKRDFSLSLGWLF